MSSKSKNYQLKVSSRKVNGVEMWEGTVSIQGVKPTKLTLKDGSSTFSTRASVVSAARYLGNRLGATIVEATAKKAAKKSVTSTKTKTSKNRTSPPSATTTTATPAN